MLGKRVQPMIIFSAERALALERVETGHAKYANDLILSEREHLCEKKMLRRVVPNS